MCKTAPDGNDDSGAASSIHTLEPPPPLPPPPPPGRQQAPTSRVANKRPRTENGVVAETNRDHCDSLLCHGPVICYDDACGLAHWLDDACHSYQR